MANKYQSAEQWLRKSETGKKITKSSPSGSSGKIQSADEWIRQKSNPVPDYQSQSSGTDERAVAASNWAKKYTETVEKLQQANEKRGNSWTTDVSGGTHDDVLSLMKEYDTIREYAKLIGEKSFEEAYRNLAKMSRTIYNENEKMARYGSDEAYQTARRQKEWYDKYRNLDYNRLEETAQGIADQEEREFVQSMAANARVERLLNMDITQAQTDLGQLRRDRDRLADLAYEAIDWTDNASRNQPDKVKDTYDSRIAKLETEITQAKRYQKEAEMSGVADRNSQNYDPKFREMAQFRGDSDLSRFINDVDGAQHGLRDPGEHPEDYVIGKTDYSQYGYDRLTQEERDVYNYWDSYDQKNGTQKAQEYLDVLQESLNSRIGTEKYESIKDSNRAMKLAFEMGTGAQGAIRGIANLGKLFTGSEDYTPASGAQIAANMILQDDRENGHKMPGFLQDEEGGKTWEEFAGESAMSIGNMAPSMGTAALLNMALPGLGVGAAAAGNIARGGSLAVMGAGIAGNAYTEAINQGYSAKNAKAYAYANAASEIGTELLFGGIEGMTGIGTDALSEALLKKCDNAILRAGVRGITDGLGETLEEGVQAVIEPWMNHVTLHKDEVLRGQDVAYSMLAGFATGAIMSGPSIALDEYGTYRTGADALNSGMNREALRSVADSFDNGTEAKRLAGKIDQSTGAYTIGRVLNEVGVSLSEQNIRDITRYLVGKNLPQDVAEHNAKLLNYVAMGGELTAKQAQVVNADEMLADAFREMVMNPDSRVNQRTKGLQNLMEAGNGSEGTQSAAPASRRNENGDAAINNPNRAVLAVESREGDTMQLRLKNGDVVDSSDVSAYHDESEALLFETARRFSTDVGDANRIANGFEGSSVSMEEYCKGVEDSYRYGLYGMNSSEIKRGSMSSAIDSEAAQSAYLAGLKKHNTDIAKAQKAEMAAREPGQEAKLHFDRAGRKFDSKRETAIATMDSLSKALGVDFWVYESYEKNGSRVYADETGAEHSAPNGWYDDNGVHIDLNAGNDGRGVMLYTLAHELTHHIRKYSPEKFHAFADVVMEGYGNRGVSADNLIQQQMAKAKKNGREVDYDTAYEEMIADSMEGILSDGKVLEKLKGLQETDPSLWETVKQWAKDVAEKIRAIVDAYKGERMDSTEGRIVANMKEILPQLEELYAEGLADSASAQMAVLDSTATDIVQSAMHDSGVKYSERVTDKDTLDFLDGQDTVKTYKTMQLVDGKLYPPMASRIEGRYEDYSILGQWEQATEHPELIRENGKFKLDKGKGQGSIEAAYNPYMHSSNLVLNDQFSGAYARDNLVTVECEVPSSELTSGYKAEYAKDAVGWHAWHTGTVAGSLRKAKGIERQVFLSRWIKPVRIVPDAEVASMYKSLLDGTDVAVPDNVVTPNLLSELKKAGVPIKESGKVKYADTRDTTVTDGDAGAKNAAKDGGVKYQARSNGSFDDAEISAIQSIGRKSINSFNASDIQKTESFAKRYWQEMGMKSPFFRSWFGDWRVNDQTSVQIADQKGDSRGVQHNDDTGWDIQVSGKVFSESKHFATKNTNAIPYLPYINDIVRKAVLLDSYGIDQNKAKSQNTLLMHSMYAVADIGNGQEVLKLYVEEMNDPNREGTAKRAYQLQNIEKASTVNGGVQGNSPSSLANTVNAIRTVSDLFAAVKSMDTIFSPNPVSKVVNSDGTPMVLYHQTGNEFTVFDPKHSGAGSSDQQTPFGIFMKTSDKNIGVKGDKQIALYANIQNPLRAANRADLVQKMKQLSPDYAALCEDYDQMNESFKAQTDAAGKALEEYMAQWRKENPSASRRAIYDDEEFNRLSDAEDETISLWEQNDLEMSTRAKEIITQCLRDNGYDGVFLSIDSGSWGRQTDAIIALDPSQVKSATDNIGTFDGQNPDIRYSDRDPDVGKMNRILQKQNAELKDTVQYLRELVRLQGKVTDGTVYTRGSVEWAAKRMIRDAGAKGDAAELTKILEGTYRAMGEGSDDMVGRIEEAAQWLVDHVPESKPKLDSYAEEILREIRGRGVRLNEGQKAEASAFMGKYQDYRRRFFGTLNVSDSAGTTLDQFWAEMSEAYPDVFGNNVSSSDMPRQLYEAIDSLKNMYEEAEFSPEEMQASALNAQMMAVWENFTKLTPIRTVADKNKAQVEDIKSRYNARIQSIREKYQGQLDELRQQRKDDVKAVRADMQEKAARQQQAAKERYQQQKADLQAAREDKQIMEREFIRFMRAYDKTSAAGETAQAQADALKTALAEEVKKHKQDNAAWDKEFKRLLREYDAAGRNIDALEENLTRTRESAKARVESRKQTAVRNQLKDLHGKLQKMILNPGKGVTAHAPTALTQAVADVCDLFVSNLEQAGVRRAGEYDARIATMQGKLAENPDLKYAQNGVDAANRQKVRIGEQSMKLAELRKQYEALKSGENAIYYDEHTSKMLEDLKNMLDGKDIYDMTSEQLEAVKQTMQSFYHSIVDANKIWMGDQNASLTDTARQWGKEINDVNVGFIRKYMGRYLNWQMSPDTFFMATSGFAKDSVGEKVSRMFAKGTERMIGVQQVYYKMFAPILENKVNQKELHNLLGNPAAKKNLVDWGLKNRDGDNVQTTRGMMLMAYLLLGQKDSRAALAESGFKVPDQKVYYKDRGRAFGDKDVGKMLTPGIAEDLSGLGNQITDMEEGLKRGDFGGMTEGDFRQRLDDLRSQRNDLILGEEGRLLGLRDNIEKMLTPMEKQIIEVARAWFSLSGELMADAHEEVHGYRPKLVEDYAPIHRDGATVWTDLRESDGSEAFNLENSGFLKERIHNNNAIVLTDLFVELGSQRDAIARYCGFVKPQKDFNRIWKIQCRGMSTSINGMIGAKFGTGNTGLGVSGEQYVKNLMKDIGGGRNSGKGVLDKFYGAAASKSLSLNPRVAASQLASIPTAAAEVGWKNMGVGFVKGLGTAVSTKKKNALAEKNAFFFQRYRGEGGITEVSDLMQKNGLWARVSGSKVGKALFNWCQNMDVFATSTMYAMAEEAAVSRGHKRGEAGFDEAVNEIYTQIIRRTQPNYTVTERSDVLRDKRAGMKMLNMFKTQSNQNLNILMQASGKLTKTIHDYRYKQNGVTKADVTNACRSFANASTAVVIGGSAAFVMLRAGVNLIWAQVKSYRDDETGEVTSDKMKAAMFQEFLSSMAGMFTLGDMAYEFIYSAVTGEKYYGMTDSAVGLLSDAIEDIMSLIQNRGKWSEMEESEKRKELRRSIGNIFGAFGVPTENAMKFVDAYEHWKLNVENGSLFSYSDSSTTDAQYRKRFLNAYRAGDEEKCDDLLALLAIRADEPNERRADITVRGGFRDSLKDKFLAGEVTEEEVRDIFSKYLDADDEDIDLMISGWKGKQDTGMTLDEMQDQYLRNLVSSEAYVKYLTDYQGKDAEKAEEAELRLRCERDTGYAYDEIKERYMEEEISNAEASEWLSTYGQVENPAKKLKEYDFEDATGWNWADRKDCYLSGGVSSADLKKWLMDIEGKRAAEADTYISNLDFEKENGYAYDEKLEKYVSGEISRQQLKNALMTRGSMFDAEADREIVAYDYIKDHPSTKLSITTAYSYTRKIDNCTYTLQSAGLTEEQFLSFREQKAKCNGTDSDGDGYRDSGSVQAQVLPIIDAMPISDEQKDTLWYFCGWSKKTLKKKAPWHNR